MFWGGQAFRNTVHTSTHSTASNEAASEQLTHGTIKQATIHSLYQGNSDPKKGTGARKPIGLSSIYCAAYNYKYPWSEIHERTISLRFLDIILRVLKLRFLYTMFPLQTN